MRVDIKESLFIFVKESLSRAQIPSTLEPTGLSRLDGKHLDGATITPWKAGRALVWDFTCLDTFAPSHIATATREAGAVAAVAEEKKRSKYRDLARTHHVALFTIETSGAFSPDALLFF